MRITDNLKENFPFITVISHVNKEYVGIMINQDSQVTSFYDYELLRTEEEKQAFLELGESWWWESNRQIPINIFLHKEIGDFRYSVRNFATKDVKIILGPIVSLNNILIKRVKRKSITLIRKIS